MLRELLKLALLPLARYCERHLVLWFDLGGDAPPPPDYTPVANASKEAAEIAARLGREQLEEARYQYDQNMAIARPVVEQQLDIARQTADQGRDYYEYGKTFRPLEQSMLRQVQGQLTPAQIVRLGVSGLNLPTLSGRVQSANVIADAANRRPASLASSVPAPGAAKPAGQAVQPGQPSQPMQQEPSSAQLAANPMPRQVPTIMRFAERGQSGGAPRFPSGGILSMLSSQDMGRMLQQQGRDPAPAPVASAPPAPRPTLPAMPTRPPASAPPPAAPVFDSEAFRSELLNMVDQRLINSRYPNYPYNPNEPQGQGA